MKSGRFTLLIVVPDCERKTPTFSCFQGLFGRINAFFLILVCLGSTRRKLEALAAEMECLKDKRTLVFANYEFLKASQIRSYFSRLKLNRQKEIKFEDYVDEDVAAFKEEQGIDQVVQLDILRFKFKIFHVTPRWEDARLSRGSSLK